MKTVQPQTMFCHYLQQHNKWGLYINLHQSEELLESMVDNDISYETITEHCIQAAGFLKAFSWEQLNTIIFDGGGYFEFDTQDAILKAFQSCICDCNEHNTPVSCYALTFGPVDERLFPHLKGSWAALDENT